MKLFLFVSLITFSFSAFTQLSGAQQVFGAASNIGRQIKQADNERKENERREEINFNYFVTIAEADTLFAKKHYSE